MTETSPLSPYIRSEPCIVEGFGVVEFVFGFDGMNQ